MVKASLFDLGNTLIEYPSPEKLRENCAKFSDQMRVDSKLLERMHELLMQDRRTGFETFKEATIERALTLALREARCPADEAEVSSMVEELYHFGFGMHTSLINGAPELMEFLKKRGIKTGIVSNTPFPGCLFKKEMERFGIAKHFQTFVWSSEFGKRKPSPGIFLKALGDLEVLPSEAAYVGDKLDRDVVGSRGVGMTSIWFDRKGTGKDHAGYRILSLNEIPSLEGLL
jgi:HAD superfamily hydrolase (TIGR01549 family)